MRQLAVIGVLAVPACADHELGAGLIFGPLIVGGVLIAWFAYQSAERKRADLARAMLAANNAMSTMGGSSAPAQRYMSADGSVGIAINPAKNALVVFARDAMADLREIAGHDVMAAELIEDGETKIATQNEGWLGRATVGGLLFGGVGAIIGATTAGTRSTSETVVNRVDLKITVNDLTSPVLVLSFLVHASRKGDGVYKEAVAAATHWHGQVSGIIHRARATLAAQAAIQQPAAPAPVAIADTKTCPYCAETIKAAAIVCRFCSRDLPAASA